MATAMAIVSAATAIKQEALEDDPDDNEEDKPKNEKGNNEESMDVDLVDLAEDDDDSM